MSSFFSKVRDGLAKTAARIRETISDRPVSTVQSTQPSLSVTEIEDALVGADVGLSATERIMTAVKSVSGGQTLQEKVAAEIKRVFAEAPPPADDGATPRVILIVGVNGTGKTTSVGKLANLF